MFNARSSAWKFIQGTWKYIASVISWLPSVDGQQVITESNFLSVGNEDDQTKGSGQVPEASRFAKGLSTSIDYDAFESALEKDDKAKQRYQELLVELKQGRLDRLGEVHSIYGQLVLKNTSKFTTKGKEETTTNSVDDKEIMRNAD